MLPQLDLITSPDVPLKDKIAYYANVNLFQGANIDEKQIKIIKEKIRVLIDSPLSRCDGLLLFEASLNQATSFYLEDWQRIIIANLTASNNTCREITYRILKLILRPSNCSSYVANIEHHTQPIIDLLITPNHSNCLAAIQCLSLCFRHYPRAVCNKLEKIEPVIIRQMDTNSTQMCEATTDCFSALPQCLVWKDCRQKASSKAFTNTLKKVLYTMQDIFNKLLNINEVDYIEHEDCGEKPELCILPDVPEMKYSEIMMLARIFSSFAICVAKFLSRENPIIEVPLLWILKFIHKVFKCSHDIQNFKPEKHKDYILLAYPTIQKGLFSILESVVLNFGLIHQIENIITILQTTIKASYSTSFTNEANCQMRNLTWRIFNSWLKRNTTQISIEVGRNAYLRQELFKDITPEYVDNIQAVALKRQNQMQPNNRKPRPTFPLPDETSNFKKNRIDTCNEALKVLRMLINTASAFQEEKIKEDIANKVFAVCYGIQKNGHSTKILFPYMNDVCRENLYECVVALGTSSDFSIKVQQQAFATLRVAQKDKSCQILYLIQRANAIARHMIHPKRNFPEAITNKNARFESPMEEDVCSGWENAIWIENHSNQENHIDSSEIDIAENNLSLSPEAHNNIEENNVQNNFASGREYASKFNRSESDNESNIEQEIIEEESNQGIKAKSFIEVVHPNNIVKNEVEVNITSDDENSSIGEEELEDSRVEEEEEEEDEEEEEEEELNVNKVVHTDQNGIPSSSEDEETATLNKSENGEYSSEEGSCEEEEISKEVSCVTKHKMESLEDNENPIKKKKLNEDALETPEVETKLTNDLQINEETNKISEDLRVNKMQQVIEDSVEVTESSTKNENLNATEIEEKTSIVNEDDMGIVSEEIVQNSPHADKDSKPCRSPTFEEMCKDLVLVEPDDLDAS